MVEVKFLFTAARAEEVVQLMDRLEEMNLNEDITRIVNIDFETFIKFFTEFKIKSNIKSNTVAFIKLLELAENMEVEEES
jgi:hypothetical protein